MTDTIIEKDTIAVTIGDDHSFDCSVVTIGRTGENAVSQFEIEIPEELSGFWAFLDFKKPNGETLKTPRLDIVDNKIEYDIPAYLLDKSGNLEVQLVLQNENGEIWKSATKKFVVLKSIDAGEDIPDTQKEDFFAEAQALLDKITEQMNNSAFVTDVTIHANKWVGTASPYSQVVTVDGATNKSQVDLTPSAEQLSIFHSKDLAFVTENDNGVITVYAIGQKPANDYTIQATVTEVNV